MNVDIKRINILQHNGIADECDHGKNRQSGEKLVTMRLTCIFDETIN